MVGKGEGRLRKISRSESVTCPDDVMDIDDNQPSLKISRPIFTEAEFSKRFSTGTRGPKTTKELLVEAKSKCECSPQCCKKKMLSYFPFINILKNYSVKEDLPNDIVAGLTLGVVLIPQGMAYSLLSGLDPVYGLYVAFFPIMLYFFFGTSRHVSIGVFAISNIMLGSTIDKANCSPSPPPDGFTTVQPNLVTSAIAGNLDLTTPMDGMASTTPGGGGVMSEEMACKLGVATALTFMTGITQLLMGLFGLGFVTMYLSRPLLKGFTTAAGFHIFTSQIPKVFGVSVARYSGPFKLYYIYRDLCLALPKTNWACVIISVPCIIVLYITKTYINPRVKRKIRVALPIELVVVIITTVCSYLINFNGRWNVKIVGFIPTSVPMPAVPDVHQMGSVIGDAIIMAVVAFSLGISVAQVFAEKHGYEVDSSQELVANGLMNTLTSFLHCFVGGSGMSRSLLGESAGQKTQVAGLVSCALVGVIIFALGPYFEPLPICVLASIILVALKGFFMQVTEIPRMWKVSKTDLSIWMVTFLGVMVLDIVLGLVVGLVYSLLTVVGRTQRPYTCLLGKLSGFDKTDVYRDINVCLEAKEIPKIKIFRFEASLYFASCSYFVDQLYKQTECDPRKLRLMQQKVEKKIAKQKALQPKDKAVSMDYTSDIDMMEEHLEIPKPHIDYIILDLGPMAYTDMMGASTLQQVVLDYEKVGVTVCLTNAKAGLRHVLTTFGVHDNVGHDKFYVSIPDAVEAAQSDKKEVQYDKQFQDDVVIVGSEQNGMPQKTSL